MPSESEFSDLHLLVCGPFEPSFFLPLNVSTPKGFGGVPVNLLVAEMCKLFRKVTVVGTSQHIIQLWSAEQDNLRLVLVPSSARARRRALTFFSKEIKSLLTEIELSKPNLIHAHWTYEFAAASLKSKVPTLVTVHDDPIKIFQQMPDAYRFIRLLMAIRNRIRMSHANFVSPYLLKQWTRYLFWPSNKVEQIVTNLPPFERVEKIGLKGKNSAYVISIGDASARKNIHSLINAWEIVQRTIPDLELILVGSGLDENSTLADYAKSLSIYNIKFVGECERDELENLIEGALLMVHPSLEESLGLIFVEAMAKGCPVIAGQASGGVSWALGNAGILIDVLDPAKIAESIFKLHSSDELRYELALRGIAQHERVFDKNLILSRYLGLYRKLVTGK